MIEIIWKASHSRPGRLPPALSSFSLVAVLLFGAGPVLAAGDDIVCEETPSGLIECHRPESIGGEGRLHNKDDFKTWFEKNLPTNETTRQVK